MRLFLYPIWVIVAIVGLLLPSSNAFATTAQNIPTQIIGGPDNPNNIFEFNGAIYFNAETTPGDMGLWKYDGHQFSIVSQHIVTIPQSHVEYRGELYIAGYPYLGSAITDTKLYKVSSGVLSAPISPMGFDEDELVVFNDVLYFTGVHPNYTVQTYDGASIGTASGFPCCLQRGVVSGNKLYFSGWHSPGSFDLYSYDGNSVTQHSTVSQMPREIQALNDSVYFIGIINQSINWDKAWITPTATSVSTINLPFQPENGSTVQFNNQIIFSKQNSNELYSFNGSSSNLFSQKYSGYGLITASHNYVFFEGLSDSTPSQLYYSNGVTESVIPNTHFSNGIATMGTIDSRLYFYDFDNSQWWVFDPQANNSEPQLVATGQNISLFEVALGLVMMGILFVLIRRITITL